jgi:drug/metabolite transporter (DMT)-like permease
VLRSVLMLMAYTTYFLAFPVMKLVDITALYATVPLFVTALAGPLLGEKITAQRWAAVVIGFVGVLIMVRPGASVFELASLLPVLSALAYASAQILARRIGLAYSAAVMSFYQNFIYLGGALILAALVTAWGSGYAGHPSVAFMLRQWVMPPLSDLVLIALCGPIAAIGMTMLGQAYRLTEVNFVTSFEYTALIWGTLWGYVVWREVPGVSSVIGAVLIVLAGLWLLTRANQQPAAAPEFLER